MAESSSFGKIISLLFFLLFLVNLILLLAFLAFVAVTCAALIPILYGIDDGTDNINNVQKGTDHIPNVEKGVDLLHVDLTTMIGQLNYFAAILLSVDSNVAALCNGQSCVAYGL